MKKNIHQFVSNFSRRDAIGENVIVLQNIFLNMGYDSKVFYHDCSEEVIEYAIPFEKYHQFSSSENLFIIHYGMKLPLLKPLINLPDIKILVYHNITPAKFFERFAPWLVETFLDSRRELGKLSSHVFAAIGDSTFNTEE